MIDLQPFDKSGFYQLIAEIPNARFISISTYKSLGFVEFQFNKVARQFQNECWNVIKMKLNKDEWLQKTKHQQVAQADSV